jgi:diamine N-acetyltransferase
VELRPTDRADLRFCLSAESDPGVAPYISPWTAEQHEAALTDPDQRHLLLRHDGRRVGFVLLAGLARADRVVEFRRLVVTERGQGLGRRAVDLVVREVFQRWGAERLWLDVKRGNRRARRIYADAGFRVERDGELVIMSRGVTPG